MSDPSKRLSRPFEKRHLQKVQFLPLVGEISTQITAKVSKQNGGQSGHQLQHPKISGGAIDDARIETRNTVPIMAFYDIPTQKIQSLPVVPPENPESASNATSARFDSHEAILFGLALLLISLTSLFLIGSKSFWLDEAYSIQLVHSWSAMWSQLFTYDHNAWLYYILLYGWTRLGNSEAYVRGLSAFFAIASLPVYYLLSKKLFGKKVALIAMFLLAVNGFYIQYAQDARSYSLFFFLCLLSTFIFIQLLHKQSKLLYVLYIFCSILGIYAHAYAVFLLAIHALMVLYIARSLWKQYAICAILIMAGGFPILFNPHHAQNALEWVPPVHLLTIGGYFFDLAAEQPVLCLLYAILCGVATFWILSMMRKGRNHTSFWKYIFVYLWLFVPLFLTFSYSLLVFPIFLSRYLITGLAPLLLLVGIGLTRIKRRFLFSLCLVSISILSILSLLGWYIGSGNQALLPGLNKNNEDWRTAVAFICNQAAVNDEVSFYAYYVHTPYDYYEQNSTMCLSKHLQEVELVSSLSPRVGSGHLPASDRRLLKNLPTSSNRIWLVISHSNVHPKNVAKLNSIKHALAKNYTLIGLKHFAGIEIQLYARSDAIADP